ncbi:MAG: glycoside hydrolase family 16 protein [Bacteroidota bacterium]
MKSCHSAFAFLAVFVAISACSKNHAGEDSLNRKPPDAIQPKAAAVCDYNQDEASLVTAGWTKTFDETFSTDLSKWNVWTGGAYNNELQHYQANNMQVTNGALLITARKENVTGSTTNFDATPKNFEYTSGRIECKTNVSASVKTPKVRVSARIKWPAAYGMWPAFWSYGDPWPTQGEIDILEARGQEPFQYQTNYFYGRRANQNLVSGAEGFVTNDVNLTSCWHVYELIWEKNTLSFLLDGQVVKTNTGGYVPNLFGKKERITLNLAVGGLFFSNLDPNQIVTGTMEIDWVKVFTSK